MLVLLDLGALTF